MATSLRTRGEGQGARFGALAVLALGFVLLLSARPANAQASTGDTAAAPAADSAPVTTVAPAATPTTVAPAAPPVTTAPATVTTVAPATTATTVAPSTGGHTIVQTSGASQQGTPGSTSQQIV
ncbi:MAG: hypothetical protein LC733_10995, partial [Actinobacteria bacterium]|nr:hypothetical protein [Actinomycetota bacterium]